MFTKLIDKIERIRYPGDPRLSEDMHAYLVHSYPNNHNYLISDGQLKPLKKLSHRYRALKACYPETVTSFLDLSMSKGYFVFDAAAQSSCELALGIDVFKEDVARCRTIQQSMGWDKPCFEQIQLGELADRIDEFGGPYQTAVMINMYQYLFFGSNRHLGSYLNHSKIFEKLRQVCDGRLIFNNRVNIQHCQNKAQIKMAGEKAGEYTLSTLLKSAAQYFDIDDRGLYGRYPLVIFHAK